jgi:hypothetical protein
MSRSPSKKKSRMKTASTPFSGGCFSFLFFPPAAVLAVTAVFMVAFGETSDPVTMGQPADLSIPQVLMIEEETPEPKPKKEKPKIAPLFTPEVHYWEDQIVKWAKDWEMDPNLVATVMQIESCGYPKARSSVGAMGLFQVMPYHFETFDSPYNPNTNAERGLAYLRLALNTYGSIKLAFAGYNGGISTAGKPEFYWPAETVRYVYWGVNIYEDAQQGKNNSPTLDEWLAKGGASLCAQADSYLGLVP